MPSLPNPETTMTIAGVGMVSDSFSSSFFLSFSFRISSILLKKATRDESSFNNSFFSTPIPPNLRGRARADDDKKKRRRKPRRERAHKKRSRAFDRVFFFTHEVLLGF